MLDSDTRYLLASFGLLLGAVGFFWTSFKRRAVIAWPKGAELRILDGLMVTVGICTTLAALFGILGTLEETAGSRHWSANLKGTALSAAILVLCGSGWRLRPRLPEPTQATEAPRS